MNYGDGDAPLKDKANFIMSMLELVVGGSGLCHFTLGRKGLTRTRRT